jgi:hypothetical protein
MTNLLTQIHNTETDEVIVREMTDEEYAQYVESITTEPAE